MGDKLTMDDIRNYDVLGKMELFEFNKANIKELKGESGVYFLFGADNKLLYIGKSIDLKQRLYQHVRKSVDQTKDFIFEVKWFSFISDSLLKTWVSLGRYEYKMIKKYKPELNYETRLYRIFEDWK